MPTTASSISGRTRALADLEGVPALAVRGQALGAQGVVDDHHVAGRGGALHAAQLGVVLAHLLEGGLDVLVGDRRGRVLDLEPLVLAERDGGADLHHRLEGQRGVLLQADVGQIRLVDGLELGLG